MERDDEPVALRVWEGVWEREGVTVVDLDVRVLFENHVVIVSVTKGVKLGELDVEEVEEIMWVVLRVAVGEEVGRGVSESEKREEAEAVNASAVGD